MTPEERFWAKVDKRGDGCWIWTAARDKAGYGVFVFRGQWTRAHRVPYLIEGRDISGAHVHHECDNLACVNPAHTDVLAPGQHKQRHRSLTCKRGHAWTPDNTRWKVNGTTLAKECRACGRMRKGGNEIKQQRTWTVDRVLASIHECASLIGKRPTAVHFNPPQARALGHDELATQHAEKQWPHITTFVRLFGSWNGAMKAAGYKSQPPGRPRRTASE